MFLELYNINGVIKAETVGKTDKNLFFGGSQYTMLEGSIKHIPKATSFYPFSKKNFP